MVMMGWFMIDSFNSNGFEIYLNDYGVRVECYNFDIKLHHNEIDDLIAALIKAKAIMASDKSK